MAEEVTQPPWDILQAGLANGRTLYWRGIGHWRVWNLREGQTRRVFFSWTLKLNGWCVWGCHMVWCVAYRIY